MEPVSSNPRVVNCGSWVCCCTFGICMRVQVGLLAVGLVPGHACQIVRVHVQSALNKVKALERKEIRKRMSAYRAERMT